MKVGTTDRTLRPASGLKRYPEIVNFFRTFCLLDILAIELDSSNKAGLLKIEQGSVMLRVAVASVKGCLIEITSLSTGRQTIVGKS